MGGIPKISRPGRVDQDCADLKAKKELAQERVIRERVEPVVLGEIRGETQAVVAKKEGVSQPAIFKRAKTPESEVLRKQYRSRREKTVKAQVAKINTKHRALITGKGWDSNDAPKANVELRAIIHADKVMGLGQDTAQPQNVATDLVGAAQAELAGLIAVFLKPSRQKELETVEAEVVETEKPKVEPLDHSVPYVSPTTDKVTGEQEQEVQGE